MQYFSVPKVRGILPSPHIIWNYTELYIKFSCGSAKSAKENRLVTLYTAEFFVGKVQNRTEIITADISAENRINRGNVSQAADGRLLAPR